MLRTYNAWILLVSVLLIPALACNYVGAQNIYGLSDEDFELLVASDPLVTYWFDYEGELEFSSQGERLVLDMTGDGGFVQKDEQIVPDMQVLIDMSGDGVDGIYRNFQLELRYVGDWFYVQARDVETGGQTEWAQMSLMDLLLGVGLRFPGASDDLSAQSPEGFTGLFDGDALEDMDLSDFGLSQHSLIRRRGDEVINGQDVAHYTIELDLRNAVTQSILASTDLLVESGIDLEELGLDTTNTQVLEFVLGPLVNSVLPYAFVEVDQYVNLESTYPERSVTDMTVQVSPGALEDLGNMFGGNGSRPNLNTYLYMDTFYRDFGRDLEVEVPEGAVRMPYSEFAESITETFSEE
jgi:hypothetical protein